MFQFRETTFNKYNPVCLTVMRTLKKNNTEMGDGKCILYILHVFSHYILTTILQDNYYFRTIYCTDRGTKEWLTRRKDEDDSSGMKKQP